MPKFQSELNILEHLSGGDYLIFFSVILACAGIVGWSKWSQRSSSGRSDLLEMILMGRRLSFPFFVATLVATWYGGIFGVTEITFNYGIYNFVTQGVFWYATYLIFAFFLIRKIRKYKSVTLPELVGEMFGPRSRVLAAIFNFFNVIPVAYAISIGLLLQALFGGSFILNMILGVGFVTSYSLVGGFRSVVLTDSIQFVVMCVSVALVLLFSITTFGGVEFLTSSLPERYFDPKGGQSWANLFVWGFIALSTLVDPNFYQRVFAADSEATAKRGILASTVIWVLFDICTTAGALYARAVIPDAEPGQAYLLFSIQVLPEYMRGLFMAGICALILSTIDSYLFISGTTFGYDFWPRKSASRWTIRFGIILSACVAIGLAMHFEGSIKDAWKTLGSYSAACLLLPMLAGYVFPSRISDRQFLYSCLAGVIVVTYWRLGPLPESLASIDEIYPGMLTTGLGLFLWSLIRKIQKPTASQIA